MQGKIAARLTELHAAERKTEIELIVIRNLIAELERLLAPDAPTLSGDPLEEIEPATASPHTNGARAVKG